MGDRVLAVDIGSTNVHCGLVDTRRRVCLRRSDFPRVRITAGLPDFLDKIKCSVPAVIAGGGSGMARKAAGILKKHACRAAVRLRWQPRLPVRFRYEKPLSLGADRIADALYAYAKYPEQNVIIIDSGTAITVDAVNSASEFIGGAILAGIETQLKGLHAAAGTLPAVRVPAGEIPFPGRSTVQCMQAGAAHGIAGALNYLVKKYKGLLGGKRTVLVTGGAWHVTRTLVDFDFIEVPDMTLVGTGLFVSCAYRTR
ncbi:MAG: type III pantothenate kinase [Chitinispirillaceae bacterium]|nr:type III pantothenate kinase [Chitinispirillaceae bacterium]